MSKSVETIYQGNYTCTTASPWNTEPIMTKAQKFSPMDLLLSAYGSCLLATLDYEAQKANFATSEIRSVISYQMSADASKLGAIHVQVFFDGVYSEEQKDLLSHAATHYCHVGNSLDAAISKTIELIYP